MYHLMVRVSKSFWCQYAYNRIAYYFMNTTTASPTTATVVPDPVCEANCSFAAHSALPWIWKKVETTATVTHAIEYHIVNNRTNATVTSTSYLTQPAISNQPRLMTNSDGTRVMEITMSLATKSGDEWVTSLTNVTYPTVFTQYNSGYRWWGVLPTTTADGEAVCSWAPWYVSGAPSNRIQIRPTYSTLANRTRITSSYTTTIPTTAYQTLAVGPFVTYTSINAYGEPPAPDPDDPKGLWYMPIGAYFDQELGVPSGISDAAVKLCTEDDWHANGFQTGEPALELTSELYLTLTSTLHDDSPDPPEMTASGVEISEQPLEPSNEVPVTDSPPAPTKTGSALPDNTNQPAPTPTLFNPDVSATAPSTGDGTALPVKEPPSDNNDDQEPPASAPVTEAPPALESTLIIGSATITRNSNSALVIGTQTLQPNTPITLNPAPANPEDDNNENAPAASATIILQTSAGLTQLIAGATTTTLAPLHAPQPGVIIAAGQTFSLNPAASNDDGPGAAVVLPDGQTLRLGASATLLPTSAVTDGVIPLPTLVALTVADGTTRLVVGSVTAALPTGWASVGSGEGRAQTVTLADGDVAGVTPVGTRGVVVSKKTVEVGESVTVKDKTVVVVGTAAGGVTEVVVGGQTVTLAADGNGAGVTGAGTGESPASSSASSGGLGGAVWDGLGGAGTSRAGTGRTSATAEETVGTGAGGASSTQTGSAVRRELGVELVLIFLGCLTLAGYW